ncbi:leucine-rich repeat protein, partial [Blautia wexlerae]|uniref:leucine-rich repeat protein n=1 Tax=Blautia wexlerae TaxID=418240 RepID=UPI0034A2B9B3
MNEKEIRIPEKYEGKEVLEIGEGAFAGCDQIERIRILDHHKNFKIKKDAFENCISLRKVSFFGGIKVESGAFRNCPKLYDFALINYYEGTEVSIADDAFDADSKVLVSADGGLPWKGSPEPFFNENGEDGWHEKEQGMDYWDYVKNNGPSQYEGTRVADFDNSVSKVRIRDNVKGIGRKAFYGSDR